MQAKVYQDAGDDSVSFAIKAYRADMLDSPSFLGKVLEKASEIIANEIIEHHLPEVLEKISPEAIANMTIASAGAKINETLAKKIPDNILHAETTRAQIFQRGIFGGLKRVG